MGISDKIEAFILELLRQEDEDKLIIQRNELAQLLGCVPSQINYVISTRFNPEKGYIVESRRGGGGYVMIRRVDTPTQKPLSKKECIGIINEMYLRRLITKRESKIMQAAVKDADNDAQRAVTLNNMINEIKQMEEI